MVPGDAERRERLKLETVQLSGAVAGGSASTGVPLSPSSAANKVEKRPADTMSGNQPSASTSSAGGSAAKRAKVEKSSVEVSPSPMTAPCRCAIVREGSFYIFPTN